jgi:hypothetical protein
MLTVKIVSVDRGPQTEEPFESEGGTIYKTAWLCHVESDGKPEVAKITSGSKQADTCISAKYIKPGGVICSKQRKEYKGKVEYYLDINATKDANGEGFKGGGFGGGGGGGRQSGGFAQNDGTGQAIGNAITNATNVVIAEMKAGTGGQCDMARLAEVAEAIFAVSRKLNGANAAKPAEGVDDAERTALIGAAMEAITKAGLRDRLEQSDVGDVALIEMWVASGKNAAAFAVKLAGMLPEAKQKPNTPENLPF